MKFKEKLIAAVKITRPLNLLMIFISVVMAAIICSPQIFSDFNIFPAALAATLTAAAGNVVNDIFDLEIDKVNRPLRPLPLEKITVKQAYFLYFCLLLISVLIALLLSLLALYIVLFSHLLLLLYSKYFKRIPFIGNLTVAFLTGLVFIYGGVVVESPAAAIIPAIFAFLINLIREIVKDMQDIEGDKKAGAISIPVKFGISKSKMLVSLFTFILITFSLYPFIAKLYKIEFFIIVMVSVNPILIYIVKNLYASDSERSLRRISNLLKLSMILGLLAIYLGA